MEDEKHKFRNAFVSVWLQWLVALWGAVRGPANTAPPVNSAAAGTLGQLAFDQNFLYVNVGVNKWKRIPLNSF